MLDGRHDPAFALLFAEQRAGLEGRESGFLLLAASCLALVSMMAGAALMLPLP